MFRIFIGQLSLDQGRHKKKIKNVDYFLIAWQLCGGLNKTYGRKSLLGNSNCNSFVCLFFVMDIPDHAKVTVGSFKFHWHMPRETTAELQRRLSRMTSTINNFIKLENWENNWTEEFGFITFIPGVSFYPFESMQYPYILGNRIGTQLVLGPQIYCSDLINDMILVCYAAMTTDATWTTYGHWFEEKTSSFHSTLDG